MFVGGRGKIKERKMRMWMVIANEEAGVEQRRETRGAIREFREEKTRSR